MGFATEKFSTKFDTAINRSRKRYDIYEEPFFIASPCLRNSKNHVYKRLLNGYNARRPAGRLKLFWTTGFERGATP